MFRESPDKKDSNNKTCRLGPHSEYNSIFGRAKTLVYDLFFIHKRQEIRGSGGRKGIFLTLVSNGAAHRPRGTSGPL